MTKRTLLAALSLIVSSTAYAEMCGTGHYDFTKGQCITSGSGLGVGAVGGIYSAYKYSKAKSITEEFTIKTYRNKNGAPADPRNVMKLTNSFTDGDRITINYQLNEADNRAYHIRLMEDNASSARSTASMNMAMSMTATKAVYNTVSDGNGGTKQEYAGQEPDMAARAMHLALAMQAQSEAADYDHKAASARSGGPVPTYDFDKIVDGETKTAPTSAEFIKSHMETGGKITAIDRLPVEKFRITKSLINHGRAGLVGVAIGLGFAAEEATAGYAAERMQTPEYRPSYQSYSEDSNSWK